VYFNKVAAYRFAQAWEYERFLRAVAAAKTDNVDLTEVEYTSEVQDFDAKLGLLPMRSGNVIYLYNNKK